MLRPSTLVGDRNIRRQEPIDHAAWLWHPDVAAGEPAFLRFTCEFPSEGETLHFHLTADQHYIFFIDGHRVARGPDRSDVPHWSFSSYDADLEPGLHRIEVAVWWLGRHAPMSMMTHRGGFALWAEGAYSSLVSTGQGPWQVIRHTGWTLRAPQFSCYHAIGDSLHIDAASWHAGEGEPVTPAVIRLPVVENETGVDLMAGWKCFPSRLPALMDYHVCKGRIRAIMDSHQPDTPFAEEHTRHPDIPAWQALLDQGTPVVVPPGRRLAVLWDFEDYCCGFHQVRLSGGRDSRLEWQWAESLYLPDKVSKGHRSEIVGKVYSGFGDGYTPDGEPRCWISYWVCAGRYVLLSIETRDEALCVEELCINEVRYPFEMEAHLDTGHAPLQGIIPLCVRALQCCSHDHFVDCPYYEQMMYVGDTRLELLAMNVMTGDTRLQERCISLFDYSRHIFGFVAERYTAREDQLSVTYAAIWVLCVRDFALWRDNPAWVKERLPGVRANLDCFLSYRADNGLLEQLPGWSFIDWVREWRTGYAPGHWSGCCGPSNLFYLLALRAAAELETMLGSPHLAAHYRELAEETEASIRRAFWNPERRIWADDLEHVHYSQHSQCLALIAGLVTPEETPHLLDQLLHAPDLAQASIYFRHYLFEALYQCKAGADLLAQYEPWYDLTKRGLYTTVESFEPTRSDCHAWGSHALYHMVASLAGVRPASAAFKTVRIAPSAVDLPFLRMSIPHPSAGELRIDLERDPGGWHGLVVLPEGCEGEFIDGDFRSACRSGENRIPRRA